MVSAPIPNELYPRVLFITSYAFNRISDGGITFSNLFSGWPKDCLATAHNDVILVANDVCNQYYHLDNSEIQKWGDSSRSPSPDTCGPANASNPSLMQAMLRKASQIVFGGGRPQSGHLTQELEQWIADNLPPWIVSDWMFVLRPTGPRVAPASFVRSWHERLRRRINESMRHHQGSLTISSPASMADTSDQ